ncbi:MAG: putative ribosome biogenesis GTPase RsgA [Francisella sp.]|jgi:putative ribosome biogenesis GTPase RsgA
MIKRYCVLQENEKIRTLLLLIKLNYKYDKNDSLQEVDLVYVVNRVEDTDIKIIIKNTWQDLETLVGYEIRLLVNNSKTSLINKLFKVQKDLCFILKIRQDPEIFKPIVESIKTASNIKVEVKEINLL